MILFEIKEVQNLLEEKFQRSELLVLALVLTFDTFNFHSFLFHYTIEYYYYITAFQSITNSNL